MTQFWIWLSRVLWLASESCDRMAIGRRALTAYKEAMQERTAANVAEAMKRLTEASARLGHDNSAANTVALYYRHIDHVRAKMFPLADWPASEQPCRNQGE